MNKLTLSYETTLPCRVWRNICAEAGSLLKASYKRMILTEELLRKKELIDTPSWKVAEKLKTKRLFIENIQAQIKNFRKKKGILPKDFFELGVPEYRSIEFTTEADDSIHNGQFKKLRIEGSVVHNGKNYSKPIYLLAKTLIRKTLRIQKEIYRLEHKIDEAYRRKEFSRIKHLFVSRYA